MKKFLITFITILLCIMIINLPVNSEDYDNLRNPFNDYQTEDKQDEENKDKIEDNEEKLKSNEDEETKNENDELEIPFNWKGLIAYDKGYLILIGTEEGSRLISEGEKIEGYTLRSVSVDKITFEKDNKKGSLKLRGEENE